MKKALLTAAAILLGLAAILLYPQLKQKDAFQEPLPQVEEESQPTPTPTEENTITEPETTVCQDETTGAELSLDEAVEIAENSECTAEGELKETRFCNQNTGTWWIDLEIDKPGCNPACVIDVNEKTTEINWRCTGLIPEDS